MAKICNFPDEMISDARKIQRSIRSLHPILLLDANVDKSSGYAALMMQKLSLIKDSTLDERGLRLYLSSIQSDFAPVQDGIMQLLQTKQNKIEKASVNKINESIIGNYYFKRKE